MFPDTAKQGDIHFITARSLPYKTRMILITLFMVTGVLTQLFLDFWFGLLFLGTGTILSLIKGYKPLPVTIKSGETWSHVTPDEYKKIKYKEREIERWDIDAFDITNKRGVIILAVFMAPIFLLFFWGFQTAL